MQKQGFYSAHHCCCTNARLLGKYPGHQFGKLEFKKETVLELEFLLELRVLLELDEFLLEFLLELE